MRGSDQFMEHIEDTITAFCEAVLCDGAINSYRGFGRKQKREGSLDYLMPETPFRLFATDNYFEQYDGPNVFAVKGQKIFVASGWPTQYGNCRSSGVRSFPNFFYYSINVLP